jgi:hypothetical protein
MGVGGDSLNSDFFHEAGLLFFSIRSRYFLVRLNFLLALFIFLDLKLLPDNIVLALVQQRLFFPNLYY